MKQSGSRLDDSDPMKNGVEKMQINVSLGNLHASASFLRNQTSKSYYGEIDLRIGKTSRVAFSTWHSSYSPIFLDLCAWKIAMGGKKQFENKYKRGKS